MKFDRRPLLLLLAAGFGLLASCGSQARRQPGGQVRIAAKPAASSAAHANGLATDICATFTLAPYSFDASGNPHAAGAPVSFTTSASNPEIDQILGCTVGPSTYAPPAGAPGYTTPPTLYNWAYLVTATNFTYCAADAGVLDPAAVSPAPAYFAPVNCSASADAELPIDYPISISVVAQSGYIDVTAGVDPTHQYIGCKQAEVVDGGLRFGESFLIDGDPNAPLGLIAFSDPSGDLEVSQYGGQSYSSDADPNVGRMYNTFYTGQLAQAGAHPQTLLQTFLSNSDQSHRFGAASESTCAGGEWVDTRHALCLTTIDGDPNAVDQDPNVATSGTLADAFLFIPGIGYAAASVASGGASIAIYSQMGLNSAGDYTAVSGPVVTADASSGFSSAGGPGEISPSAGFNDGLESPTLQLSDADPNSSVIAFTGIYVDPSTTGQFIIGESTSSDSGWAKLSWSSGAGWAISAFQPFSIGGVPPGFGASASGCVVPPPACPCWSAALAQEVSELRAAGFQSVADVQAPISYNWTINNQDMSRYASLQMDDEGSDGHYCDGANETGDNGFVSISASQWTTCLGLYATTLVRDPCLLNGGAGPCGGDTPYCKSDSPGPASCDAIPCFFDAAQIVSAVLSTGYSPLNPVTECTSATGDDGNGGVQSYVELSASSLDGSHSLEAGGALDATNSNAQWGLYFPTNPLFENLEYVDAATAASCQQEVLSACTMLGLQLNQPLGCVGLDNCPSGQVCDSQSNVCIEPPALTGIAVSPNPALYNQALTTSGTIQFTATAYYSNGSSAALNPADVQWASDSGCCTPDQTPGLIDIVQTGNANISASYTTSAGTFSAWAPLQVINDPFVPTAGLNYPRFGHTATRLENGTVLIAGGNANGQVLDTAELYDPVEKTFTLLANRLTVPRYEATATLLTSGANRGKVLLVAGQTSSQNYLDSAELYDPVQQTFTASASHLVRARVQPTAVLLPASSGYPGGLVLVEGGRDHPSPEASSELYDPETDTFTPTADMMSPRAGHTATLLSNGVVLAAGGYNSVNQPGGEDGSQPGNFPSDTMPLVAEWFDPSADTVTGAASLNAGRYGHTATLLIDGSVILVGGYDINASHAVTTAELYQWSAGGGAFVGTTGAPVAARVSHTATLLGGGKVLLAGGSTPAPMASAELYDPSTGTFSATADMSVARSQQTATLLLDGTVLIAGGRGSYGNGNATASAELFHPQ